MNRAALFLTVVFCLATSACATNPRIVRPDSLLARLTPTLHTIAPVKPTAAPERYAPSTAQRFEAAQVRIEEPSFHDLHPLEWTRTVQQHTADVLNDAAGPVPDGPPIATTVTFTTSDDIREGQAGTRMNVVLESRLPNGEVVRSTPISEDFVLASERSWSQAASMLGVLTLGSAAGLAGVIMLVPPAGLVLTYAMTATLGVSLVFLSLTSVNEIFLALSAEERWSNLYLLALRAHAKDVAAALADDEAPPS